MGRKSKRADFYLKLDDSIIGKGLEHISTGKYMGKIIGYHYDEDDGLFLDLDRGESHPSIQWSVLSHYKIVKAKKGRKK